MPTSCRSRWKRLIVAAKREKPHWGARKIRERLLRRLPHAMSSRPQHHSCHPGPARTGEAEARAADTRRRHSAVGRTAPNELWCTDYKGEFKLGDQRYCYPLTVTDHASRYLLLCEALESTRKSWLSRPSSACSTSAACRARSAPITVSPSLLPTACFNLSRLSVWWLRLGISHRAHPPGHPQQNGRHERMHLTLKKEATRPAGPTSFSSRPSSTTSWKSLTPNGRTRRST